MREKMLLLFLTLGLFGCASVQKSGYLTDYSQLADGKHLEKVVVSPELGSRENFGILIEDPNMDYVVEEDKPLALSSQDYFVEVLQKRIESITGLKTATVVGSPGNPGETHLTLRTAMTRLDPGSRLGRWFAGDLGAGHSHVQVEGELLDPATNISLMTFADQRSGSAAGGWNPTGAISKQLIEADLDGIAKAIAETIADARK